MEEYLVEKYLLCYITPISWGRSGVSLIEDIEKIDDNYVFIKFYRCLDKRKERIERIKRLQDNEIIDLLNNKMSIRMIMTATPFITGGRLYFNDLPSEVKMNYTFGVEEYLKDKI